MLNRFTKFRRQHRFKSSLRAYTLMAEILRSKSATNVLKGKAEALRVQLDETGYLHPEQMEALEAMKLEITGACE